jgi:hypothetical protein
MRGLDARNAERGHRHEYAEHNDNENNDGSRGEHTVTGPVAPDKRSTWARVPATPRHDLSTISQRLVSATERRNRFEHLTFPRPSFSLEEAGMNRSDDLRKNAENCVALADTADSDPKKKRYARMATAWNNLADTQAWLDGETEKKAASKHQSD